MVCGLTDSELPEPPGAGDGEGAGDGVGDGDVGAGELLPHCVTASVNNPSARTVSRRCVRMPASQQRRFRYAAARAAVQGCADRGKCKMQNSKCKHRVCKWKSGKVEKWKSKLKAHPPQR